MGAACPGMKAGDCGTRSVQVHDEDEEEGYVYEAQMGLLIR